MILTPVSSSNVKAIGFDAGVIRVEFLTGKTYDFPGQTQEDFDRFLAAPSKGRFVQDHLLCPALKLKLPKTGAELSRELQGINGPLHSYEPDSCCGAALSKALRADLLDNTDKWECPKCGLLWTPEMHGEVRHWMPRPYFIVVRPRT